MTDVLFSMKKRLDNTSHLQPSAMYKSIDG